MSAEEIKALEGIKDWKSLPWYRKELQSRDIPPAARWVLETYSGIPAVDVEHSVVRVRDLAFNVFPYPCIGLFNFLDIILPRLPEYDEICKRVKGGEKFLDLGCCFGQEIRYLASVGVPTENLYGTDLQPGFLKYGYELFRDESRLKATFIPANILQSNSPLLAYKNTFSVILASSFFHLFDRPTQIIVAKVCVSLLRDERGVFLVGKQMADVEAGEYSKGKQIEGTNYRHNPASWKEFWDQVGEETGTRWSVDATMENTDVLFGEEKDTKPWNLQGTRRMYFCVKRI